MSSCRMATSSSKPRVIDRLIKLIQSMTEEDQLTLLRQIEDQKSANKRQHARTPYKSKVYFATDEKAFKSNIRDISSSGVFIETDQAIYVGQEVMLTFNHPDKIKPIRKKGVVVRRTDDGIGIQFQKKKKK